MRKPSVYMTSFAAVLGLVTACGDGNKGPQGPDGPAGFDALVRLGEQPAGDRCALGGVRSEMGYDENRNGVLDTFEIVRVHFACHQPDGAAGTEGARGKDGADGVHALITSSSEPAGSNCPVGGQKIEQGLDRDGDGVLADSEVVSRSYLCHAVDGAHGQDGTNAIVSVSVEAAGAACPHGGQKIEYGADADANGTLDPQEVDGTSYVCNGGPGADAFDGLTHVSHEPAGAHCASGGVKVEHGLDSDRSGTLDASEVIGIRYVCHGENGVDGANSLVRVSPEPAGDHCALGGTKIEEGLDTDKDGTLEDGEVDQTSYVCRGADGSDATPGAAGHNALVAVQNEPAGANCPQGGVRVRVGVDADRDGSLSDGETSSTEYVCNAADGVDGVDGAPGRRALVNIRHEAAGVHCANGGERVESGFDADRDGILSAAEVDTFSYVCRGADGNDGSDGADGFDSLVDVSSEPAGPNCAHGGYRIQTGTDEDRNGVLDAAEVELTSYACHGAAGADGAAGSHGDAGHDSLVAVEDEPAGVHCALGGEKITWGIDDNRNGTLDAEEIDGTRYVCDGAAGAHGSDGSDGADGLNALVRVTPEPAGSNCSAGGQRIESGLDDDGNGSLDPSEVQATSYVCHGLPLRANLLRCGNSGRDVTQFIPSGVSLNLVASCTPDANTQAMLVTRSGANSVNADALKAYLSAGGVVLTEWSISDEIFTKAFTPVTQGAGMGACYDRAPTVGQFTPSDPFWQANTFQGIAAYESGCGYDVSHFPGLIPLAGWSASAVAIGYRDLGAGRLWLTDFDWQDTDSGAYAYTNQLMGYMITHRR